MLPDPEQVPLAKVEQVADWLGLGRTAAYNAVHRGELPSIRIGRKLLVPVADLRRVLGLDDGWSV